jgi:hypothetical protein
MSKKLKVGLVARADNSGLGILSWDLSKNLDFDKIMVVSAEYPTDCERYDEEKTTICDRGIPSLYEIKTFLEGLDVVLTLETPYNWNFYKIAREMGVKTALMVMYEWTPPQKKMPSEPDMYLCPTQLDYDTLWGNKHLVPVPVNRREVEFKERTEAKTFVFNNGHGGYGGRNSLQEFLYAIQMVKADVKFIIRTQVQMDESIRDSRIEIQIGEVDYDKLWKEGDIYIHAHKFDGLSLPLQEALSAGYPVIAVDREPYNTILPKEMLFKPDAEYEVQLPFRSIKAVTINPRTLADKIEEFAGMSDEKIKELSNKSDELAKEMSWSKLKPVYEQTFQELYEGK